MSHFSCSICIELLTAGQNVVATNCGHVFHLNCMNAWNLQSKTCPDCRNRVPSNLPLLRIYLKEADEKGEEDAESKQDVKAELIADLLRINEKLEDELKKLKGSPKRKAPKRRS